MARLHDLRHTHASLLLSAGVPIKVVSERLGHADPAVTLRTYQHVTPGRQAAAAVHNPKVAGSDPAPATKERVRGPFRRSGKRLFA